MNDIRRSNPMRCSLPSGASHEHNRNHQLGHAAAHERARGITRCPLDLLGLLRLVEVQIVVKRTVVDEVRELGYD
jgi:hypothetical protein